MKYCPSCGKKTKLKYYCKHCKKEHARVYGEAKELGLNVSKKYSIQGISEHLDKAKSGYI